MAEGTEHCPTSPCWPTGAHGTVSQRHEHPLCWLVTAILASCECTILTRSPLCPTNLFLWCAEAMYEAWQQDPSSVHASWRALFNNESHGLGKGQSYTPPGYTPPAASAVSSSEAPHDGAIYDHIKVGIDKTHLAFVDCCTLPRCCLIPCVVHILIPSPWV
jgi:hypothetical protein